ncbi:syntaxin-8-like [Clytia hemisphaerica]|uniref:t-SNARE coiled-coil homology domain-containing protein n=1 Tax=Clytia hemisphaerica TaxID=252671 RepID=A0A7M5X8A7_9CNID
MARDNWGQDYRDVEEFAQEIMELINERNSQSRIGGSGSAKIQSLIRTKLQNFSQEIEKLKKQLARSRNSITPQEADRRQQQIYKLVSREKQLNEAFKPQGGGFGGNDSGRSGLLNEGFDVERNSGGFGGASYGGNTFDDENLTPDGYRQRQDQVIREQDKGLDALHAVIQRQKQMGHAIGDEVDHQNDLIDDINDHVDKTDQKLIRTEAKLQKTTKKAGTCCLMVVVVLLFIAIIVVAAVPK